MHELDSDDEHEGAFQEASSTLDDDDSADARSDNSEASSSHDFFDAPELADLIAQATSLKASGNAHFTAGRSHAALEDYREGIACLPAYKPPAKRTNNSSIKGKGKARPDLDEELETDADGARPTSTGEDIRSKDRIRELQGDEDEQEFIEEGKKSDEEREMEQLRSALWCNVAACQLKLSLYKEAAEAATNALQDNPTYVKALQRRANANEQLGTWSSLSTALEDYNTLAKLPDTPKSMMTSIKMAQRRLPGRIEDKKQSETAEMLDKLKGLGNSFLGKFGMSTNNFQFVKNEETGGYSMNFTQNPGGASKAG